MWATDRERNFHAFYQLLKGLPEADKSGMGLSGKDAKDFHYLNQSTVIEHNAGIRCTPSSLFPQVMALQMSIPPDEPQAQLQPPRQPPLQIQAPPS